MFNKKGQIGETITWMVATVIIVLVLIFGIYAASGGGILKDVFGTKEVKYSSISDDFAQNSFHSFLKTNLVGEINYDYFVREKDFDNSLIGEFSKSVFEGIYEREDYEEVWMGILSRGPGSPKNDYFGEMTESLNLRERHGDYAAQDYLFHGIYLDENKSVVLLLVKK